MGKRLSKKNLAERLKKLRKQRGIENIDSFIGTPFGFAHSVINDLEKLCNELGKAILLAIETGEPKNGRQPVRIGW